VQTRKSVSKSEADKRRERLAAALRENLKRRKTHERNAAVTTQDQNACSARSEAPGADGLSRPKSPR